MDKIADVVAVVESIFGNRTVRLVAGEFVSEREYISAPGRCCVIHFLSGYESANVSATRYIGVAMQPRGSGSRLVCSVDAALAIIEKEVKWTLG